MKLYITQSLGNHMIKQKSITHFRMRRRKSNYKMVQRLLKKAYIKLKEEFPRVLLIKRVKEEDTFIAYITDENHPDRMTKICIGYNIFVPYDEERFMMNIGDYEVDNLELISNESFLEDFIEKFRNALNIKYELWEKSKNAIDKACANLISGFQDTVILEKNIYERAYAIVYVAYNNKRMKFKLNSVVPNVFVEEGDIVSARHIGLKGIPSYLSSYSCLTDDIVITIKECSYRINNEIERMANLHKV